MSDTPRALFAARLVQARELRGLSQRGLGDLMGLGKKKGSSRINRYEHQVTAIGFDNLDLLAKVLNVPAAYLIAESPKMADAILAVAEYPGVADAVAALAKIAPAHQADIAEILKKASADPALLEQLRALVEPKDEP